MTRLPATDHEVCGEMLQTLSRLYWATREDKYLERARPMGDLFLLERLPTRANKLKLSDHGCEIISGLSELFLVESHLRTERAERYRKPMQEMLDRVLEVGANPDGQLYWTIDPASGKVLRNQLSDCWGYVYDAFYTYDLATGEGRYRPALERVLRSLPKYTEYKYGGSDGLCDAFESAIDLLNRMPFEESLPFLDRTMERAWPLQRADGSVERWYGDGSFGRACVMCERQAAAGLARLYPVCRAQGSLHHVGCAEWLPSDLDARSKRRPHAVGRVDCREVWSPILSAYPGPMTKRTKSQSAAPWDGLFAAPN